MFGVMYTGVLPGSIMMQHLPSIVAAMALAPKPRSRVLDMCSAPGGKTTMLAQIMQDHGEIVAFDRTHVKVTTQLCEGCISGNDAKSKTNYGV